MSTTTRDRVRSEVFDACAAHYCPKHAAFLAETLLDPIPNAAEEEFRRIGMADFYLGDGTLPVGTVLGLLADHLESLWGGPNTAQTIHAVRRDLESRIPPRRPGNRPAHGVSSVDPGA